jgi:hypothetical protein
MRTVATGRLVQRPLWSRAVELVMTWRVQERETLSMVSYDEPLAAASTASVHRFKPIRAV